MKKIILFGAGRALPSRLEFCKRLGDIRVVEIWDHHPQAGEILLQGEHIPVCLPHALEKRLPVYIIPERFAQEIRTQLLAETNLSREDLFSWQDIFDDVRQEMIHRYHHSKDAQLRTCASYMERLGKLQAFNNDFADEYTSDRRPVHVDWDEDAGLWYTDWHGRCLFMKRGATQREAEGYFRTILCEQDRRSPHHYPVDWEAFPADVVLVCGAAEGFFALDAIGHTKEVYIFEVDDDWLDALRHTFADARDTRVHIIDKFVGNYEDEKHATIDELALSGKRLLVKMDIEGAERDALAGMECTIEQNEAVRVIACAYHRHGDAPQIASYLLERHFEVQYSDGYMWFPYESRIQAELRHGLVIGERRKKHVYLWGAGQNLEKTYECLRLDTCIVDGIIDSCAAECKPFRSYEIQSPEILKTVAFDAVIITPKKWESIAAAYEAMGCPKEKLVCFCKMDDAKHPVFRQEVIQLQKLKRDCKKWRFRAENAPFEYAAKEDVHVLDGGTLLQKILQERCSLSRFGDGEFSMILMEARPWFQSPDKELAQRLRRVLDMQMPHFLIAIADNYGNLEKYTENAADGIREYQMENHHRDRILELLHPLRTYYDAYVTRPYLMYRDKSWGEKIFDLWKKIFTGRDILIVEGKFSRFGCGSDLLAGAASVRRILAPEKNAFQRYNQIMESIQRHANATDLVLISLGPTATVLVVDVAKMGIQAIDIGQLDNEYDWYRMGVTDRVPIIGKMTAEAQWNRNIEDVGDAAFEASIAERCF